MGEAEVAPGKRDRYLFSLSVIGVLKQFPRTGRFFLKQFPRMTAMIVLGHQILGPLSMSPPDPHPLNVLSPNWAQKNSLRLSRHPKQIKRASNLDANCELAFQGDHSTRVKWERDQQRS